MGTVFAQILDRTIQRDAALELLRGLGETPEEKHRTPQGTAGMGTLERRPLLLCEHDQPLGEIKGLLELPTQTVAVPESAQHWKELGRSIELIA